MSIESKPISSSFSICDLFFHFDQCLSFLPLFISIFLSSFSFKIIISSSFISFLFCPLTIFFFYFTPFFCKHYYFYWVSNKLVFLFWMQEEPKYFRGRSHLQSDAYEIPPNNHRALRVTEKLFIIIIFLKVHEKELMIEYCLPSVHFR